LTGKKERMINRANWKLVREYLVYRREVDQVSKSSQRVEETWLRHLLEWFDSRSINEAPKIRPTFQEYIMTARLDNSKNKLSSNYIKKVIRAAYHFLSWVKSHKRGFGAISQNWLDTIKPPRLTIEPKEHEAVTLNEIRAMAKAPVYSLRDRRIRAAAIFLFLSGIRIGAFVTLPLSAVDLDNLTIKQWPKLGVRTKFKKHATTYLLDIPDLVSVIKDWDKEVRQVCGDNGLWFAIVSPETGDLVTGSQVAGEFRTTRARKDLKDWLEKVNLPYHSPHKFRHGHAVYGLKNSKDVKALKAVSQNLMHSNLSITDGIYGILSENDVRGQIMNLGQKIASDDIQDIKDIVPLLEKLLVNLKA
jgi:integrase